MNYKQDAEVMKTTSIRAHDRMMSFVFSLMLTSAFLATAPEGMIAASMGPNIKLIAEQIRSSGFPGTAGISDPPSGIVPASANIKAVNDVAPPLSEEKLQKIIAHIRKNGKWVNFYGPTATLLGLTTNNDRLRVVHVALKIPRTGVGHGFYLLSEDSGYLLLKRTEANLTTYHVDSHLNLILAVVAENGGLYYVSKTKAEIELKEELLEWAELSNGFAELER